MSPREREGQLLSGEAVVAVDGAHRIMGANRAAQQLMAGELTVGEVLRLTGFLEGPDLSLAQSALDAALGQGDPSHQIQAQARDAAGQDFTCEYSINPLFGPGRQVVGAMINLRDLDFAPLSSGRLEPGESLPRMPRLGYQSLVDNLAEGIFTINTRWRITSFNQRAEQLTGYNSSEVLGRYCWDIFRSDLCGAGCPLRTTLETGVTRMDQDVRMLGKGGKRLGVLVNTSVVRDRAGTVVGAVESFRPLAGLETNLPPDSGSTFSDIVGASEPMQRLFNMLPDVAVSGANVLIQGESGTGKELFARALHHHSPRRDGPFVAVNCSALAESLLESELFGHEKAAFTGAVRSKVGRFELAKGGTIFLDEIGELKPELQVKLLRVLEQRVFERVGGTRLIPMDARIIAATNLDLAQAMAQGRFREDLFYRLRTVPLTLPPLRRRKDDISLLVAHFIKQLNQRYAKQVRSVDPKVTRMFMSYDWPGNVRELERVMEHAYVFVKGPVILPAYLPSLNEFWRERGAASGGEETPTGRAAAPEEGERQAILDALSQCGGHRREAAELLGISRTSLWRRMKALDLA
ncbi:MAG: sigma 54-interacting transcriptional regulator [Desulfarculus sp.]|nr:sigma 54-interacting transcriptional regulator [Pseudomonadota bacterium]MBU4576330.1 sigma 54-interacting transcriptional regulator [Pseudomonadota bacterium]MBU4596884.1 sigma 54-interacting transcriptional regulator [Pseudomonadota bacterium]MBV1717297.1 sigma 54-interacting transcriptional regulator [Desulfarculus sp.]MBV1739533.1 sigma 54-interacting transcriptional regulator [Desulfarculus sp.]